MPLISNISTLQQFSTDILNNGTIPLVTMWDQALCVYLEVCLTNILGYFPRIFCILDVYHYHQRQGNKNIGRIPLVDSMGLQLLH